LVILGPFAFSVFIFCHPFGERDSLKKQIIHKEHLDILKSPLPTFSKVCLLIAVPPLATFSKVRLLTQLDNLKSPLATFSKVRLLPRLNRLLHSQKSAC